VNVGEQLRQVWRLGRRSAGAGQRGAEARRAALEAAGEAERKTLALPAILSPVQFPARHLPKPTPANLRRFAETPIVRRAINVIKDRIAAMDWQVRVRRGARADSVAGYAEKLSALRRVLEEPNDVDSFRTLLEQAIEDALTGGFGAIEMEATGDPARPAMLWPVDGASIRVNAKWDGQVDTPRYAQAAQGQLESSAVELRDDQLMYVRMNPRSFTPFGLPPLMLGLGADVNRSTAAEMADEAFRGAISPLAMLIAGHITRDLFGKCIGWRDFEFVFNDLSARDEQTELEVQVRLLQAGVLTVDEVRAMRGLAPMGEAGTRD